MPRRASQQVSLFPFLAVLVCTMGALILLLLVTTRQIRSGQVRQLAEAAKRAETAESTSSTLRQATAPVETPTVPQLQVTPLLPDVRPQPDLPPLPNLDDLRRRIAESEEQLRSLRAQRERDEAFRATADETLEDAQTTHAQLLAEERLLEEQQREFTKQLAEAEMQHENDQKALSNLRQALAQTSALVSQLKDQLDDTVSRVAQSESFRKLKIEFQSSDGMAEEPVLVECGPRSLRLVAENIALTERDLSGFPTADNPLIAAVRTIVKSRNQKLDDAYVLLLVRPDGSLPFYAAQKLLRGSGIRFGYELIDSDQALQVDPASQETVVACQEAIQQSIERRDVLYARLGALIDGDGNRVILSESGNMIFQPRSEAQIPNVANVDQSRGGAYDGRSGLSPRSTRAQDTRPRIATSSALKDSHRMAGEAVGGFLRELGSARARQRNDDRLQSGVAAAPQRKDQDADTGPAIRPRDNTFQTYPSVPDDAAGHSRKDTSNATPSMLTEAQNPFADAEPGSTGPPTADRSPVNPLPPDGSARPRNERWEPSGSRSAQQRATANAVPDSQEMTVESFPGFARSEDGSYQPGTTSGEPSQDSVGWSGMDSVTMGSPGNSSDAERAGTQASANSSSTQTSPPGTSGAGALAAGITAPGDSADNEAPRVADVGDRRAALDQAAIERFLRLARARQKMLARQDSGSVQPVTVFVDSNWLTIEDQDSRRLVNLDDATLHTEFVRGIVDEVTIDNGDSSLPALPLVRFVVSPGATVTHHRLQRLLDAVALPHESTLSMQPYAIDAPQSRVAASSFGSDLSEGLE